MHAVAHGDAVFVLGVVRFDVILSRSSRLFLCDCELGKNTGSETQPEQMNQTGFLHGTSVIYGSGKDSLMDAWAISPLFIETCARSIPATRRRLFSFRPYQR